MVTIMVMSKDNSSGKSAAKRGFPKGGGKGLKGSNLYTPVSQATIDKIKKQGMSVALKKAATSSNASYVQGVKRMYGATRLAAAKKVAAAPKKATGSMAYTAGSPKSGKATYTTGSGVRYASSTTKKAAPAKTKNLKKNPLVKFVTSRVGGKSGGYGNSK
jgi:cytoskeletal protein RodZ